MTEPIVLTLERYFTTADLAEDEHPLMPFEVPAGIGRLQVRYEFDHPVSSADVGHKEGNIVCIGIFDPRGASCKGRASVGGAGTRVRSSPSRPTRRRRATLLGLFSRAPGTSCWGCNNCTPRAAACA